MEDAEILSLAIETDQYNMKFKLIDVNSGSELFD
jgi:hypothetical protein